MRTVIILINNLDLSRLALLTQLTNFYNEEKKRLAYVVKKPDFEKISHEKASIN